jgi:hypothetical protein
VTVPAAHWLPQADRGDGRGERLRRSFEDRLERRDGESTTAALAVERLERLQAAEHERRAALAAIAELPEGLRGLLAEVLALPADVQDTLADLLV